MFALNVRPAFHGHTQRWNIDEDNSHRTQLPKLSDDLAQRPHNIQFYLSLDLLEFCNSRGRGFHCTQLRMGKLLGLPKTL